MATDGGAVAKRKKVFWADFHNHNGIGYGQGSLDRTYQLAEMLQLDALAFTPHGFWHDAPDSDPRMVEFHKNGFEQVQKRFPEIREKARQADKSPEMAAFLAFEWHSSRYGDYHVLLPDFEGEVQAPNSLAELQKYVGARGGIMIPHHVAYRRNWRGCDWDSLDSTLSPVVDIFSEHGCSLTSDTHLPMLLHSMGGADKSQTVNERLKRGLVAGFVASTDNHHGHPAAWGEGLTGVIAESPSRNSILEALRKRRCYAVTGDRIELGFNLDGHPMGSQLPSQTRRRLECQVAGCARLRSVRILKNGQYVNEFPLTAAEVTPSEANWVALDFGWGSMQGDNLTQWRIGLQVIGGEIERVNPRFSGGQGSVTMLNGIRSQGRSDLVIEAFSSRRNTRPVNGLALKVVGGPETRLELNIEAQQDAAVLSRQVSSSLAELAGEDAWAAMSDLFSCPRLRLGQLCASQQTEFAGSWTDPRPGENDFYYLEVMQCNGQMAWSSPIWCGAVSTETIKTASARTPFGPGSHQINDFLYS